MTLEPKVLDAHEITRVWNLALTMAANDPSGEGDLANVFPEALEMYLGFREFLESGGVEIDDGNAVWTSSMEGPSLVLRARPKPPAPPRAPAGIKPGGGKPGGKKSI